MNRESLELELKYYRRQLGRIPADSTNPDDHVAEKMYCYLIEATILRLEVLDNLERVGQGGNPCSSDCG